MLTSCLFKRYINDEILTSPLKNACYENLILYLQIFWCIDIDSCSELTCPLKVLYFLLLNYYVDVFGEICILDFVPWGTAIIWKHFTDHVFVEIFEWNLKVIILQKNLKSLFWVNIFSWMLSLTIMIIIIWKHLCAFQFFRTA